jgi:hypothetical protein
MRRTRRLSLQIEEDVVPRKEIEQNTIVDPADPALTDEVLDETVPGGAYIVNDIPVDADGVPLEAPPDPPIVLSADATPEQKADFVERQHQYEKDKLKREESKRLRDQWEKDKKEEKDKKDKEREKRQADAAKKE